ncbi:S-layer homology domain-containing protein [Paenibacillus sp. MBLB4367]|uniref:S-layer homology domain-containing protein n=1 Tax=Paenibacillus sp. MBLB4367 TaxID=3384767 RepID=UPI003907F916
MRQLNVGKFLKAGRGLALAVTAAVVLLAGNAGARAEQGGAKIFSDIKGHWAEQTIYRLSDEGILDGFPDGTFRPDEPVAADQFVKILLLSFTQQFPNGERRWTNEFVQSLSPANRNVLEQDFRDFSFKPSTVGYWAKPYIDLAGGLNLIGKNQFPDFKAKLKREDVAEIVYYTVKETEYLEDETFSLNAASVIGDLQSATARQQKFIAETFAKGIMEGYPNGYFGVSRVVTRAESLAILERIVDKSKRISAKNGVSGQYDRIVPTKDGSYKKLMFPSETMYRAYDVMQQAGKLRGTNFDLEETTLRLFKDAETKAKFLKRTAGDGPYEEAAIWLEPAYRTYGITVRLQEGMLARNEEALRTFVNFLFASDAATFQKHFANVYGTLQNGKAVENGTVQIGKFSVETDVAPDGQSVVFSIVEKEK